MCLIVLPQVNQQAGWVVLAPIQQCYGRLCHSTIALRDRRMSDTGRIEVSDTAHSHLATDNHRHSSTGAGAGSSDLASYSQQPGGFGGADCRIAESFSLGQVRQVNSIPGPETTSNSHLLFFNLFSNALSPFLQHTSEIFLVLCQSSSPKLM